MDKTESSEEENENSKSKLSNPDAKVGYFELYRFANSQDVLMITIGWIAAIIVGLAEPVVMIVFGRSLGDFTTVGKLAFCDFNSSVYNDGLCALTVKYMSTNVTDYDPAGIMDSITNEIFWFIGIGLVSWLSGYLQTTCLMMSAQRQITQLRTTYFRSIIRQDMSYFDTHDIGELNTRMLDDVKKIQDGIAEKVGVAIQSLSQFVGGLIIGFIYGWKMTLVILASLPFIAVSGYLWSNMTTESAKDGLDAYAIAGGIAEEVLSGIRTVTAFSGQKREVERYKKTLAVAEKAGIKKSVLTGLAMGLLYFILFCSYGLSFWYGAKLVVQDDYTVDQVIIIFAGVLIGAFGLSQLMKHAEYLAIAQSAAFTIFKIIDRVPTIDTQSDEGKIVSGINAVEFKNVKFTYPARPDQEVLSNVSFRVEPGKTTALCGQSGCGKSTCFQLIKRFYDADSGSVLVDGVDIKELNVKSLRSLIGVVSQEPVLFETTVEENIRMGRLDVTKEDIENATKVANAYDFIQKLPEVWDTHVGEGGATLSGGQKQRIALARALVRNPKILLLDEATSALDTGSEAVVQKALENASKGRTTIVIAHRLSTIRNADTIIGFHDGKVMEQGTHDELMKIDNGVYFNLCNMQTLPDESIETREIEKKKSSKELLLEEKKSEVLSEEKTEDSNVFLKILKLNSKEYPLMALGSLLSLAAGGIQPLWALIFGDIFALFGKFNCAVNKDIYNLTGDFESFNGTTFNADQIKLESEFCELEKFEDRINFLTIIFCVLGVASFFAYFGSLSFFGISSERLTTRLRKRSFRKLLQLEIGYFDDPMNSTGALTTRLASDASKVQGATGRQINVMFQSIGALICGFTIAFYYSWMLTLACFAFVPFLIAATVIMMSIFTDKFSEEEQKSLEEAGKVAAEATINIRTVADLGREDAFAEKFKENIKKTLVGKDRKINWYGFMYGANLGMVFMMYAGVFYFAAWMMANDKIHSNDFADIYKVLFGIIFAAMTAGEASAMAPDYGQAIGAANRVFKLLALESKIDPGNNGGKIPEKCTGEITFNQVKFHYPTRPDVQVLKGLNLDVKPGETLALIGQSGSGKSTCIQLLERFYDGSSGDITIDNERISELNVNWLRRQIGFVQQEPILFNESIRDNILYGLDMDTPGNRETSLDKNKVGIKNDENELLMRKAAEDANALKFIENLPDKFDTICGKKGSQLSGGQKQRIAIARALVRKPKILLLDEATSALDTESEKLVQDALHRAQEGRTCILIAHRMSTIVNADKIAVIDNGVISEIGGVRGRVPSKTTEE